MLSKIRISNHRLAIETGRFSKTPRNERICLHCKTDNVSEIDDEQHLLLQLSHIKAELEKVVALDAMKLHNGAWRL